MDLLQNSKEFCQFLSSLTQSLGTAALQHAIQATSLFSREYSCTALPPGTLSVFTQFTGPQNMTTVVISKHESTTPKLAEKEESYELCESMSESYEKIQDSDDEQNESNTVSRFKVNALLSHELVNIGQPLAQKRVYLSESHPLYAGQTLNSVCSTIKDFEYSLCPLALDKARYVCSLYALGCQRFNESLPSIWVVCKSEKQRIVGLGCSYKLENSTLINHTLFQEEPILETEINVPQKLTLPKSSKHVNQTNQASVCSEYEITTSSTSAVDKHSGSVAVQFAWSDPDSILCAPPENSEAVLKISSTPGYKYSPVLSTYNEVDTLLRFARISCGEETWLPLDSEDLDMMTAAAPTKLASAMVDSFLEEVASPLSQPPEVTVISPTSDSSVCEPRKDLDFLERLWMFAKDATSLEDLQQIFATVFKAVLLDQVQPFIHRSNSSLLANLLRQVLVCRDADERQMLAPKFQTLLSESKIVPCLVQLGIEKLKRDYRAFFVGADIATSDQLEPFFNSKASLLKQCCSLCNLHNVLELNASALSFLDLPTSMLSALTKTALDVYKERQFNGFTTTPVFSLPLPAFSIPLKSLISLCASLRPKSWSLAQTSSYPGGNMQGRCCVTVYREQPLLQLSKLSDTETETIVYYAYRAQCNVIIM